MDIVEPSIEKYLMGLTSGDDEPVLLAMEELAREKGFPIIGRLCGRSLEVLARSVGAKRVFELGSGFGYSGYWFSRATGADGEIHLTDGDPDNRDKALDFLGQAGLDSPITFHVGDALESLATVDGEFDVVYCDVDKDGYPDAWQQGSKRVRVGGLYMCDNMFFNGEVLDPDNHELGRAVHDTNLAISSDPDWRSFINPTRDGVVVAVRVA
jgi:predicted O-methyltransferase YrrM